MQPGVTVVLAMVWLYASVVGTTSLNSSRFSLDQYSPLAPHHQLYQRVGGQLGWKDQSPVGNQPFDLPIGPRRSSTASFESKYPEKDSLQLKTKGNSAGDDFSPLVEDKRRRKGFMDQKIDAWSTKDPEQSSLELEDPFIADDTFQDQGPGSMEIYKLDLLREKSLLSPTPLTRYLLKGKGKTPKKTNQAGWKAKTTEHKSTSPDIFYKQSNSFDDLSTKMPSNNDPFSIGGVPELQVGCEGLEASDHKQKRSIHFHGKDKSPKELWPDVTPVSLDLEYDFSSGEEEEEMDELVRLKKLETTTKGIKRNRGDMEATRYSDFFNDKRPPEKLPSRGDLGKSNAQNSTAEKAPNSDKAKREALKDHQRRKILWFDTNQQFQGRSKRGIWGFGEDEGVASSDELQTENQRRRQDYERRRKEEERRRLEEQRRRLQEEHRRLEEARRRSNSDVERIKQEYERALEERSRQAEDRRRRLQPTGWQSNYEAERRKQQQEQDRKNLEQRKREWMLKRRQEEEERRRQQQARNEPSNLLYPMRVTPDETRPYNVDAERRLREQQEKLNEYIQRNQPVNVNLIDRQREEEARRRQAAERRKMEEERKLQEYIRRNQPVQMVNASADGTRGYNWSRYPSPSGGRRNHGPSAPTNIDPSGYVDERRRKEAARRAEEERIRERERQEEEQLRREALRREEEVRRLQSRRYEEQRKRQEADRRRKELMEEQARRSQVGRMRPSYEEQRRRQDTNLVPANLVLNESRRATEHERQRQQQERWRLEAERRRQQGSRAKEASEREQRARAMKEQWRRQEEARLNALPVSARIIVHPAVSSTSFNLSSRTDFDGDIDFPGVSPHRPGVGIPNFPAAPTRRPPVKSLPACVWAVVQCCQINTNRLVTCFETMGCPGVNWDPNPCRSSITQAAKEQVLKFYAEIEEDNRGL